MADHQYSFAGAPWDTADPTQHGPYHGYEYPFAGHEHERHETIDRDRGSGGWPGYNPHARRRDERLDATTRGVEDGDERIRNYRDEGLDFIDRNHRPRLGANEAAGWSTATLRGWPADEVERPRHDPFAFPRDERRRSDRDRSRDYFDPEGRRVPQSSERRLDSPSADFEDLDPPNERSRRSARRDRDDLFAFPGEVTGERSSRYRHGERIHRQRDRHYYG